MFIDPSVTPTDNGVYHEFRCRRDDQCGRQRDRTLHVLGPGIVITGLYTPGNYDAATGIATASGFATEQLPGVARLIMVPFTTTFKAGGPGVGQFTLTADDGYFVVPPFVDTEVVLRGIITVR